MQKTFNKIYIGWKDFGLMVESLAEQIHEGKVKFDGVYGIPRGGLPIAVALSHKLDLPLVSVPSSKTLLIDDISDTGETLERFKHLYKEIATLFNTDWTKTKPKYWVREKENKTDWIVFPWEC